MRQNLVVGLMAVFLVAPALADKPESADEVKPAAEQKDAYHAAMQAKDEYEYEEDGAKKLKKQKTPMDEQDELKGLEKQAAKKSEQEQKELGKGSETDQKAKENRSKLRKFLAALSGWLRIGR